MPLTDDLERLDTAIRQLHAKWDMFFSGAEKKPPLELQGQVESIIKRYGNAEIRNNGERFRYQSLTARFTTFNELWQKRLRAREEGKVFGLHGLRAEQLVPAAPARSAPARPGPQQAPEYRVEDARRDDAAVRALYQGFVEQRRRAGEGPAPAFESFRQLIAHQTDRLRSEKGARAVDFRLETKDGKVSLKARLVR